MSKISSYPIQSIIVGTDKVIGSDAINDMATKNFTFDDIDIFLNTNNKIESNALRYQYQNWNTGDVRRSGTISFANSGAGTPAFSSLTTFMLSRVIGSFFYKSPSQNIDYNYNPTVTFVIPCKNEEKAILNTISKCFESNYPKNKIQVIAVNDGSTDKTSEIVKKNINEDYIVFIDNKKNKGKAACLNQGIQASKGEFIATMDSDSEVSEDALKKTLPYFKEKRVGAVTVTVKVKNPRNFLQKVIEVEYALGLSLALKVLSFFNSVHVTPGPFSVYRRSMFDKIGMFDVDNITEDLEIAYRIQRNGYNIACCTTTHVKTVIPDNLSALHKQRKRWYSGALLTVWKHKGVLFNPKMGTFGFVLPYMYILMFLGLSLFFFSSYLGLSNFMKSMGFFSLTNFNFWSYITFQNFDILALSTLTFLGLLAIFTTFVMALVGLKFAKKSIRKTIPGFVGFIFIFLMYQAFWASSFYTVLLRKKLKW